MRKTDIAWAAGFFDGEGCVSIMRVKPDKPVFALRVDVAQVDKAPIDKLQSLWGGSVTLYHSPSKKHWRPNYRWNLYGDNAAKFLRDVLPYLVLKDLQAELAIAYQEKRIGRTHRNAKRTPEQVANDEDTYVLMRELKQ